MQEYVSHAGVGPGALRYALGADGARGEEEIDSGGGEVDASGLQGAARGRVGIARRARSRHLTVFVKT